MKPHQDWEILIPEINISAFLIPADFGNRHKSSRDKNGDERLVVLNAVAKPVIEGQRGLDLVWVFPYGMPSRNGKATPIHRMNDSAWTNSRIRAAKKHQECFLCPAPKGFASIRIHDLKHTFGRLRAAGVTEDGRRAC